MSGINSIIVVCNQCKKKVNAGEQYIGKTVPCPGCKAPLTIMDNSFPPESLIGDLTPSESKPTVPLSNRELISERQEHQPIQYAKPPTPKQKYPALRIVVSIYRILGAMFAVLGVIILLGAIYTSIRTSGFGIGPMEIMSGLVTIASFAVVSISLFALGEIILVALDIEANTRRQCEEAK